jgi:hypothetical protein
MQPFGQVRRGRRADRGLFPLAELLWRQGRDQEALTVIDQRRTVVPPESRATFEQGRAQLRAGNRR